MQVALPACKQAKSLVIVLTKLPLVLDWCYGASGWPAWHQVSGEANTGAANEHRKMEVHCASFQPLALELAVFR